MILKLYVGSVKKYTYGKHIPVLNFKTCYSLYQIYFNRNLKVKIIYVLQLYF